MGPVSATFGLATLAVVAVTHLPWARRPDADDVGERDARLFSFALAGYWILYECVRALCGQEAADWPTPTIDALLAAMIVVRAVRQPDRWKLTVILCFLGQTCAHVAYRFIPVLDHLTGTPEALSDDARFRYALIRNALYAIMLLAVVAPGLGNVVRVVRRRRRTAALARQGHSVGPQ